MWRVNSEDQMEMQGPSLRPIERVITKLHEGGANPSEIGRRIGKKPGTVSRILEMAALREGMPGSPRTSDHTLRPVERVVLKLRARGESYGEIGNRLRRSGRHIQNIERFAELKRAD